MITIKLFIKGFGAGVLGGFLGAVAIVNSGSLESMATLLPQNITDYGFAGPVIMLGYAVIGGGIISGWLFIALNKWLHKAVTPARTFGQAALIYLGSFLLFLVSIYLVILGMTVL